jgi:hypothetical protein
MTNSSSREPSKDPNPAKPDATSAPETNAETAPDDARAERDSGEIGGPKGPEPTRFGDWEQKGRCSDF